jgi:deoxyadenosine/deoxycytidine kinase
MFLQKVAIFWLLSYFSIKTFNIAVYLRSNPADCLRRVQQRARAEEKNTVSLVRFYLPITSFEKMNFQEYLEHLHKMHEEWLKPSDGAKHVVLRSGESCPIIVSANLIKNVFFRFCISEKVKEMFLQTIDVDPNSHALENDYERLVNTLTSM